MKKTLVFALTAFAAFSFANAAQAQDGDLAAGEKVFKKCKACHQVGEGAKKKVGPVLNNVIGAKAGAGEGFKYSAAMVEAGANGMIWTEENLQGYLEKPRTFIPKNKMAFAGLKKPEDRVNVIVYLKQFSETPPAQ